MGGKEGKTIRGKNSLPSFLFPTNYTIEQKNQLINYCSLSLMWITLLQWKRTVYIGL